MYLSIRKAFNYPLSNDSADVVESRFPHSSCHDSDASENVQWLVKKKVVNNGEGVPEDTLAAETGRFYRR